MSLAVDYKSGKTPSFYVCGRCRAGGCKLWRRAATFTIALYCLGCAERSEKSVFDPRRLDSIGGLVAAVPTEEGGSYWGYSSVPAAGCAWWDRLPLRTGPGPHEWSPRKDGIPD